MEFVKSSKATAKIKGWFSRERRENALSEGRDSVTVAIRRAGHPLKGIDVELESVAVQLGFADLEGLYISVGERRTSTQSVVQRLTRELKPEETAEAVMADRLPTPHKRRTPSSGDVIVEGLEDMLVRMAKCCGPVPGDGIIGFVTIGRGVSVHRADCGNIGSLSERSERMVDVAWADEQTGTFFV